MISTLPGHGGQCHDIALDRIMTNTNTYSIESRETFSSILLYMDHSTGPR